MTGSKGDHVAMSGYAEKVMRLNESRNSKYDKATLV